ncbi:MAG: DUF5686 and carboxypeptidase regulatory-like domain-containing protein [Chitinophagales bacterium]|nr:DUF5686 and carboxypeptidase regulatory-like domain-containing protein [Chitinophagales bacterium]MCZ2394500.1 DUF5686 and carboxypeptidase regulatory-like domain-containing protein [Chitinophagales bacterium]
MKYFKLLIIGLLFFIPQIVWGQSFHIKGTIIDKVEREPLSFCNIIIPQLKDGFLTDENGEFSKTLSHPIDSMIVSYLGFKTFVLKFPVEDPENIFIEMIGDENILEQITVYAPRRREKDTTAWRIYKNVVENKPINQPSTHSYFEYEEYNKMVGSFYNFSPKLLNRKIIRPFKFIFENYDSTADGRLFVPLILKEEITQHYFRKEPKKEKSITIAQKVSGIEQAEISNLLNIALDNMDAYSNELTIGGSSFMLPFAEGAWFKYRFYVIDSTQNKDNEWIYHLGFSPNVKGELAFLGQAWIHAPTYAIQKIDLKLDKDINFNWVNDFSAVQEFEYLENKFWVKKKDVRTSGIALTQKKKSKMVHLEQTKLYSKFKINQAISDSIFESKRLYAENYRKQKDSFWLENRAETLSQSQNNVYFLIDSLKNTKAFKRYKNFGRTMATGFYKAGPVDFGNLNNMLTYNPMEGFRIRLSHKSNRDFSQKFWYNIYGAYGTNDHKFKYGVLVKYRFKREDLLFHEIGASYKDDYQRFSLSNSTNDEYDYILNAFLRKDAIKDLVYVKDFQVYHKREWNSVFMTETNLNYKQYQSIPGLKEFTNTSPNGEKTVIHQFKVFSPKIQFNLTPGAKFIRVDDKKIFLKGKMPRIAIDYSFSKKGFLGSDYNFHRIGLLVEQRLPSPIGNTKYQLGLNKLFGEIPYPLLFIHQGNENFLRDYKRFSNMKEGEFAADQELTFLLEHHFNGFFFNKIPFVKKLQLREIFIYKMALSSLDKKKIGYLDMPEDMKGLDGFYAEIGFGVENILKLLEIQFTWRLTQKDIPDVNKFAIKFWISPKF